MKNPMSAEEINKTLAKFFYEQCAGTTTGHIAMIPNNPTLFALVKAHSGMDDNCYAATPAQFAEILRLIADSLDEQK